MTQVTLHGFVSHVRHECPNPTKRSITTLPSKVNLSHAINFTVLCGASLVTYPADYRGNEPFELHRAYASVTLVLCACPTPVCAGLAKRCGVNEGVSSSLLSSLELSDTQVY